MALDATARAAVKQLLERELKNLRASAMMIGKMTNKVDQASDGPALIKSLTQAIKMFISVDAASGIEAQLKKLI